MNKNIRKCLITLLGGFIVGLDTELFLKPAHLAPGGVCGLAVPLNYLFHIPIWLLIIIINVPIFIIAYFNYGSVYTAFSSIGMLSSVVASYLFEKFFPNFHLASGDLMLYSVFSGFLMGVGGGIAILENSGTGGTDILARTLKKKFKNLTVGKSVLFINSIIIFSNGMIFKNFEVVLYSIISLYIQSKVLDVLNEGINYSKVAFIISEESRQISEFIINVLKRGATSIYGKSMYTNHKKSIIMTVIKKHQINQLKTCIRICDPNAFVIIADSKEVLGRGFD